MQLIFKRGVPTLVKMGLNRSKTSFLRHQAIKIKEEKRTSKKSPESVM